MIEPYSATTLIIGFLIIFGIIIPILGVIPKVREIISLRYLVIVVFLACTIGVIVNFSTLDVATRNTVIVATAVLSGIFVCCRSLEKALYKGWIGQQHVELSVEKGDMRASATIDPKEAPKSKDNNNNNNNNKGVDDLK